MRLAIYTYIKNRNIYITLANPSRNKISICERVEFFVLIYANESLLLSVLPLDIKLMLK